MVSNIDPGNNLGSDQIQPKYNLSEYFQQQQQKETTKVQQVPVALPAGFDGAKVQKFKEMMSERIKEMEIQMAEKDKINEKQKKQLTKRVAENKDLLEEMKEQNAAIDHFK